MEMKKKITPCLGVILLLLCFFQLSAKEKEPVWVGTWATAQQLVEPHNNPPKPGLSGHSLRQIVRVSIGGDRLRLRFSNVFSEEPVHLKAVSIAVSRGAGAIALTTLKRLQFDGNEGITMPAHGSAVSDPISFPLEPGSQLAVTIYFGETSATVTGHPGSRTSSYLLEGNQTGRADFAHALTTDHWYVLSGIEVQAVPEAAAIVVLGNSITDGRGSGTNKQNRWTDILSERLLQNAPTAKLGVLNLGIGGNCVLRGGLGPTALKRFDRDVLGHENVRWLLILEGINDIGGIRKAEDAPQVAQELISAYQYMIDQAHANGIKVYGCTILPFAKSFYDAPYKQQARDTVNQWIRTSGSFDAVIDFDELMRSKTDTRTILADMHDGDFLHPNEKGYQRMGKFVDLNLFKSGKETARRVLSRGWLGDISQYRSIAN